MNNVCSNKLCYYKTIYINAMTEQPNYNSTFVFTKTFTILLHNQPFNMFHLLFLLLPLFAFSLRIPSSS